MAVVVYRELSPEMPEHVRQWLDKRSQLIEIQDKKGNTHYIIENDTPRDAEVTEAIVGPPGCTIGFGVYTDEGNRVGMYRDVKGAEEAAQKARMVSFESDIEVEWDSVDGPK